MGIEEVLSTPRSHWQRAYVERASRSRNADENYLCSAIIAYAVRIHPGNMLPALRYLADFKAGWSFGEGQGKALP